MWVLLGVLVAINSPPGEKLQNACAGLCRLNIYEHIVNVREISDPKIGFVFDDESFSAPVMGKKYGQPPKEESGAEGSSASELSNLMPDESASKEGAVRSRS